MSRADPILSHKKLLRSPKTQNRITKTIGDVMASSGYVYVLMNNSMQNAIKIGRTSRNPQERANELSSVTGVPSPFIVAYDAHFDDCIKAEDFIHKKLDALGYRLSSNREFFIAPLKEVINIILEAQKVLKSQETSEVNGKTKQSQSVSNAEIENIDGDNNPRKDLESLALYHWNIDDFDQSYILFKQAVDAGSTLSYFHLGTMTLSGWGCLEDEREGMAFLKKGAECGDNWCCGALGSVYMRKEQYKLSLQYYEKYLQTDGILLPHYGREEMLVTLLQNIGPLKTSGYIEENLWGFIDKYQKTFLAIKDDLIKYIRYILSTLNDSDIESKNFYSMIGRALKDIP